VVVTASATQREAEKRLADRIDLLIDDIHAQLFLVVVADDLGTEHEKAGRGNLFVPLFLPGAGKQITCDLLAHELVERFVLVKRIDDVVSKSPSVVVGKILVRPVRIGIAGDIQPVAAPALAKLCGTKQPIDHALDGFRRLVALKSFHVFRCRRQADEVERQAP
jgi:hypothetical protein